MSWQVSGKSLPSGAHPVVTKEVDRLFDELDTLMKTPDVQDALTARGVNASIAMLVADGLRAYLQGDKPKAIEDLSVATEEITQRYAQAAKGDA
ncbi:MAG: hypothetical protein NVS3B20_19750 [Polyangiales bacterium]